MHKIHVYIILSIIKEQVWGLPTSSIHELELRWMIIDSQICIDRLIYVMPPLPIQRETSASDVNIWWPQMLSPVWYFLLIIGGKCEWVNNRWWFPIGIIFPYNRSGEWEPPFNTWLDYKFRIDCWIGLI